MSGVVTNLASITEADGLPPTYSAHAKRAAATIARDAGDLERARALLDSALDAYSAVGDRVGQAVCLITRGDWLAAPFSSPLLLDYAAVEGAMEGSDLDWVLESMEARRSEVDIDAAVSAYSDAEAMLAREAAPRARAALQLRHSYLASVDEDFDGALDFAAKAAKEFEACEDRYGQHVAIAHVEHARVGKGELPDDQAARAIGRWGHTAGSFSYAQGIGLSLGRAGRHWLIRQGDYERALACYRLAASAYEELGAASNRIQSLVDQAKTYRAVGDSSTATFFFGRALDEMPAAIAARPTVRRELRRRECLIGMELYLLSLQERDPDGLELAAARLREGSRGLAAVDAHAGEPDHAGPLSEGQDLQDAVVELAARDQVEQSAVLIPLYRAQTARDEGDDGAARVGFANALSAAKALGGSKGGFLEAVVLTAMRDHDRALEAFQSAERQAKKDPFWNLVSGTVGVDEHRARELRSRLEQRASFLTRVEAYPEAQQCFEELDSHPNGQGWRSEQPWSELADRGEVSEGLGGFDKALEYYERGIEELERRGQTLSRDELRTALAGGRGVQHLYFQATRAALRAAKLEGAGDRRESLNARAFAYAEQGKARALLDLMAGSAAMAAGKPGDGELKRSWRQLNAEVTLARGLLAERRRRGELAPGAAWVAELERRVEMGLASLRSLEARLSAEQPGFLRAINPRASVMALSEVADRLEPDTVLLQYVFLGEELLGWTITRNGITRSWRVDVGEGRLARMIDSLRDACERRRLDWREQARELSETLLAPFAREIDAHSRLIVVPYGAGHELPFHVLPWNGEPLVASHAVCVLPSASALQFLAGRAHPAPTGPILAVGNPENMSYRAPGTDHATPQRPLKAARAEAEWVASTAAGSLPLLDHDATETEVRRQIGRYPILHFATHGVLEQAPLLSSLLLADGQALTVHELLGLDLSADLVVLSACRTGQGVSTGGDEVVGLTRALLASGARGAVVSLWPVDDVTTSILMRDFYTNLGAGPAQALRQAQEHVRSLDHDTWRSEAESIVAGVSGESRHVLGAVEASNAATDHPYYWAPFVYVGA